MDTLTTEISGIQIKSLYLHYKTVKINDSMQRINQIEFEDNSSPSAISKKGEILFDVIDAIAIFENYHKLCNDVLTSSKFGPILPSELSSFLNLTRKKMGQWKHVRNNLGGHLKLEVIENFCERHNYKGVFLSNQLEADFKGVLLKMMLGEAINDTLIKSNLFTENIDLTNPLELNRFIDLFMSDWELALGLFTKLNEFLYKIGRNDKLKISTREDIGIIKF